MRAKVNFYRRRDPVQPLTVTAVVHKWTCNETPALRIGDRIHEVDSFWEGFENHPKAEVRAYQHAVDLGEAPESVTVDPQCCSPVR